MRPLRSVLGTLAVLLFLFAGAAAQAANAPPGNSAIDEYLETVPVASGNQSPRGPDRKPGGPILTPVQRDVLARHGTDGKELAAIVESSAPRSQRHKPLPESDGRSPLAKVAQATLGDSGDGGLGIVLPLILLSALLVTLTAILLRRRPGSPPSE